MHTFKIINLAQYAGSEKLKYIKMNAKRSIINSKKKVSVTIKIEYIFEEKKN